MRIFKTRMFSKWSKKNRISDSDIVRAVKEIEKGLFDADLGQKIIKKRIARRGAGKSGGYRTILAYVSGKKAFFLYAFSKKEKDNINEKEKEALSILGKSLLAMNDLEIEKRLKNGSLVEILEEKNEK